MKQTAVEYLVKDLTSILKEIPTSEIQNTSITYAVKKALKIEKIQIKYYFKNGVKCKQEQTIEEVFEWLTTNNYLTYLKETMIKDFNKFKNK